MPRTIILCDNANIHVDLLKHDKVHLRYNGTKVLASNVRYCIEGKQNNNHSAPESSHQTYKHKRNTKPTDEDMRAQRVSYSDKVKSHLETRQTEHAAQVGATPNTEQVPAQVVTGGDSDRWKYQSQNQYDEAKQVKPGIHNWQYPVSPTIYPSMTYDKQDCATTNTEQVPAQVVTRGDSDRWNYQSQNKYDEAKQVKPGIHNWQYPMSPNIYPSMTYHKQPDVQQMMHNTHSPSMPAHQSHYPHYYIRTY